VPHCPHRSSSVPAAPAPPKPGLTDGGPGIYLFWPIPVGLTTPTGSILADSGRIDLCHQLPRGELLKAVVDAAGQRAQCSCQHGSGQWSPRRLLKSRGAPTLVAILARSTHGLAGVVTGLLERASEVELLGQLGVEDGARAEARLHHQQLRSTKDSNTKGVVDAYDGGPMATMAARHAALFIRGKLVGRLNRLMAMHIAASSCRS
jgi:hypothetical protein